MATVMGVLREMGFKNAREREVWFNEHTPEIEDFLIKNGITATLKKYCTSHRVLERLGLIARGAGKNKSYKWVVAPAETSEEILARFLETLPPNVDIGDIVNLAMKGQKDEIDRLNKELADVLAKLAAKETELTETQTKLTNAETQLVAANKEIKTLEEEQQKLAVKLEARKNELSKAQVELRRLKFPIRNLRAG